LSLPVTSAWTRWCCLTDYENALSRHGQDWQRTVHGDRRSLCDGGPAQPECQQRRDFRRPADPGDPPGGSLADRRALRSAIPHRDRLCEKSGHCRLAFAKRHGRAGRSALRHVASEGDPVTGWTRRCMTDREQCTLLDRTTERRWIEAPRAVPRSGEWTRIPQVSRIPETSRRSPAPLVAVEQALQKVRSYGCLH